MLSDRASQMVPLRDGCQWESRPVRSIAKPVSVLGITHEVDPEFLEHLRREAIEQPELPWEP